MIKYIIVNAFLLLTFLSIAQTKNKDVLITSSGNGTSQELAKQTALRNAIEQARNQPKTVTYNNIHWR